MRSFWFVGLSVLCTPLLGGSFFGQEWIKSRDESLVVSATNVPLTGLLREWCQVCLHECVIDHEIKQKMTLSLSSIDCEGLLEILEMGIEKEALGSGLLFRKKGKGDWQGYHCQHRSPEDIALLLKRLLSTSAKSEQLLADNITGWLWVPKPFFLKHESLIKQLDQQTPQYRLTVAWVRVSEFEWEELGIKIDEDKLHQWLRGIMVEASLPEVWSWLKILSKGSKITVFSEANMLLLPEEVSEVWVSQVAQGLRLDKKGQKVAQDIPEKTKVTILPKIQSENHLVLDLSVTDGYLPSDDTQYKQSDLLYKMKVPIQVGSSRLLSGLSRIETLHHRRCLPVLSKLPIFGRFFCASKHYQANRQYALVLTLSLT